MPSLLLLLLLGACATNSYVPTPPAPEVQLAPYSAGRGMDVTVYLLGQRTRWDRELPSLDLGEGLEVVGVAVEESGLAAAHVRVAEDAPLGFHDAFVRFGEHELRLKDAFIVETGGMVLQPAYGRLGETMDVTITGFNTVFQEGYTYGAFGAAEQGVMVNSMQVAGEGLAVANITIASDAAPGYVDVSVYNGPQAWTAYSGFRIDRGGISLAIEPNFAYQGETIEELQIRGKGTHFVAGQTQFFLDPGPCQYQFDCEVVVDALDVDDAETAWATVTISNGASLGLRDARAVTGLEQVVARDAFDVLETPINCRDNAIVSTSMSIMRLVDNATGSYSESVSAQVAFLQPLDPPCGSGGSSPLPYDLDFVFPIDNSTADCPTPPTCDAGPYVYLESALNTVRLARFFDPLTNLYVYGPDQPLTLDDYAFDTWYSLRAEGSTDPDMIPAFLAEDILITVPSDFSIIEPVIWGSSSYDPSQGLQLSWTPAMTYPNAMLAAQLSCPDPQTGDGEYLVTIPWDDGSYLWPPAALGSLREGSCTFVMQSAIQGPFWKLPYLDPASAYINQANSRLVWAGYLELVTP